MTSARRHLLSRRGFCLCCMTAPAGAALGGWLTPREAFAQASRIVELIKSEAAKAPINVHRLRGNIAVLTGPDGKLLVDAGIGVSRPQLTTAE